MEQMLYKVVLQELQTQEVGVEAVINILPVVLVMLVVLVFALLDGVIKKGDSVKESRGWP